MVKLKEKFFTFDENVWGRHLGRMVTVGNNRCLGLDRQGTLRYFLNVSPVAFKRFGVNTLWLTNDYIADRSSHNRTRESAMLEFCEQMGYPLDSVKVSPLRIVAKYNGEEYTTETEDGDNLYAPKKYLRIPLD